MSADFGAWRATPRSSISWLHIVLFVTAVAAVALIATASQAAGVSRMVIFGDSLSDTGNMYRLTRHRSPARSRYYRGRYSNGRNWVDYVRSDTGMRIDNDAHGGALSGYGNLGGRRYPGLRTQIDRYLAKRPRGVNRRALYVLWAGANDLFAQVGRKSLVSIRRRAAENLTTAVSQLATHGARRIVVVTLPDMGRTPYARSSKRYSRGRLSKFSRRFNQGLRRMLAATGLSVTVVDVYPLLGRIQAAPAKFGLSDAVRSCLAVRCRKPNKFLFYDDRHPSSRGHRILADFLEASFAKQ